MKIADITKNAVDRFPVLLTKPEEVQAFLMQALTAYQDLAGCTRKQRVLASDVQDGGLYVMPESCLALSSAVDALGDFVICDMSDDDEGNIILYINEPKAVYPLAVEYFVNLAYYADKPDLHVPNRIAGMIINYLECLIAMDNDDRVARVESAGKMDTSRTPTRLDRMAQKTALEEQFKANREIISLVSVHPR